MRHTNIIVDLTGSSRTYYLVREKQFFTVQDLLDYYKDNDVKNLERVNHVRFLTPLLRPTRRSYDDNSSSNSGSSTSLFYPPDTPAPPPPDRPPLPQRPSMQQRQRNGSQSSLGALAIQDASLPGFYPDPFSSPMSTSGRPDNRPPAPLPGGHKAAGLYYSTPRDVDQDISERLKEGLKQNDRCDCGIPREMADMPLGWTVHKSKDPGTYGRLFFQNIEGVTTWKIPHEVQTCMTVKQNYNIRTLTEMFSNSPSLSKSRSTFHMYLESPASSSAGSLSSDTVPQNSNDVRLDQNHRASVVMHNGQNNVTGNNLSTQF